MSTAFIIIYIVIAVILLALINFAVIKRKNGKKKAQLEQSQQSTGASNETYQSKFSIKDDASETSRAEKAQRSVADDQESSESTRHETHDDSAEREAQNTGHDGYVDVNS